MGLLCAALSRGTARERAVAVGGERADCGTSHIAGSVLVVR